MEVREAIQSRRSIRKYQNRPVEAEKLTMLLDSAHLAPSGKNAQPCSFIVIQDPAQRQAVYNTCGRYDYLLEVPLLIALVGDLKSRVKAESKPMDIMAEQYTEERHRIIRDCAIAGDHLVQQAQELGLGTIWVGNFTQEAIRETLRAPKDNYVLALLAIGYPAESPEPRPRKPVADTVYYDYYGQREPK